MSEHGQPENESGKSKQKLPPNPTCIRVPVLARKRDARLPLREVTVTTYSLASISAAKFLFRAKMFWLNATSLQEYSHMPPSQRSPNDRDTSGSWRRSPRTPPTCTACRLQLRFHLLYSDLSPLRKSRATSLHSCVPPCLVLLASFARARRAARPSQTDGQPIHQSSLSLSLSPFLPPSLPALPALLIVGITTLVPSYCSFWFASHVLLAVSALQRCLLSDYSLALSRIVRS